MEKSFRNERVAALMKILGDSPNKVFTLSHFRETFAVAKSTLSEDIDLLRRVLKAHDFGVLESIPGSAGGIRYRPCPTPEGATAYVQDLCTTLREPWRILPGGGFSLADLLGDPRKVRRMAAIIAGHFYSAMPDFVLAVESDGIPIGLMAAEALGTPLVVARRKGDTLSLSPRALQEDHTALLVDDFLGTGATLKAMMDLVTQFNVAVAGAAVVMDAADPPKKHIEGVFSLMTLHTKPGDPASFVIKPSEVLRSL